MLNTRIAKRIDLLREAVKSVVDRYDLRPAAKLSRNGSARQRLNGSFEQKLDVLLWSTIGPLVLIALSITDEKPVCAECDIGRLPTGRDVTAHTLFCQVDHGDSIHCR